MKKKIMGVILCMVMVVTLIGCGGQSKDKSTAGDTGNDKSASVTGTENSSGTDKAGKKASDITVSVVLHAMNSSFYKKIQDGAEQAGKDLGCNVKVTACQTASSLDEQVGLLETAIASGTDAIATVTWDKTGFNSTIKKAEDAGIPVIGFNQDAQGCGTKAFIGQDYKTAGYQMGKYMFGTVMKGKGTYIVASCGPTDEALVARESGIDAAAKEYPGIKKLQTIDIGTDLTTAYGVIENAYLANKEVNAILGVDVFSEAIGNVVHDYKLQGKVYAAGFDLTEGTLNHIKNGDMQLTVGQNPYLQGYYSVVECFSNIANGSSFINIDTGAQMVTSDNVNEVEPE